MMHIVHCLRNRDVHWTVPELYWDHLCVWSPYQEPTTSAIAQWYQTQNLLLQMTNSKVHNVSLTMTVRRFLFALKHILFKCVSVIARSLIRLFQLQSRFDTSKNTSSIPMFFLHTYPIVSGWVALSTYVWSGHWHLIGWPSATSFFI